MVSYVSFFSFLYGGLFNVWLQMISSKDFNFVGYTYKNFEIVNDYQVPGMGTSYPLALIYLNVGRKIIVAC